MNMNQTSSMNEITPNTDFSMSQAKSNSEDVSSTRSFSSRERMTLLPDDFVPSDDDVICGRGKKCYAHIGNDRFRQRVIGMLDEYRKARSKLDKSKVLSDVVEQVRQNSPTGGFVKQDSDGRWYEVGDFLAREKTSQAFRDALHENYKSSNVAKKKRRQQDFSRVGKPSKRPSDSDMIASRMEKLTFGFGKARKYPERNIWYFRQTVSNFVPYLKFQGQKGISVTSSIDRLLNCGMIVKAHIRIVMDPLPVSTFPRVILRRELS